MTSNEKTKAEQLRLNGLSAAQIAESLGLSVNTVKAHLRRHVGKAKVTTYVERPGFCKQCGKAVKKSTLL